jgi:hypothetical protein
MIVLEGGIMRALPNPPKYRYLVVPWGDASTGDIANAIGQANMVQNMIHFEYGESLPLEANRYLLSQGFLDLDRAAKDLLKKSATKKLVFDRLILVTGKPYSEPGEDATNVTNFIENGYFLEEKLASNPNVSIVSYWIWQQLPRNKALPALKPTGRRDIVPYLIYSFGVITLHQMVEIAFHPDTRGCPLDYCYHVKEIDRFFDNGKFCKECDEYLESKCEEGTLTATQLETVKRLLGLSVGRSIQSAIKSSRSMPRSFNDKYASCFICYGQPDSEFSYRIYRALTRRRIKSWQYDMLHTPGERTWREIKKNLANAEKVLVICSVLSLQRDGVLREIEELVDEAPEKIIPISLDNKWMAPKFKIRRGTRDLKPFLMEQNYINFTTPEFDVSIERLIKALKK